MNVETLYKVVLWILPSPTFLKISSSIKINLDYMLLLYQKYFQ